VFVASSCLPELGFRIVCTLCERAESGTEGKVTALWVALRAWLGCFHDCACTHLLAV